MIFSKFLFYSKIDEVISDPWTFSCYIFWIQWFVFQNQLTFSKFVFFFKIDDIFQIHDFSFLQNWCNHFKYVNVFSFKTTMNLLWISELFLNLWTFLNFWIFFWNSETFSELMNIWSKPLNFLNSWFFLLFQKSRLTVNSKPNVQRKWPAKWQVEWPRALGRPAGAPLPRRGAWSVV